MERAWAVACVVDDQRTHQARASLGLRATSASGRGGRVKSRGTRDLIGEKPDERLGGGARLFIVETGRPS